MRDLTIFVCTYNSALTLEKCLTSVTNCEPDSKVVVIDHDSTDSTTVIAERFGAEVHRENVGLGYARQLALELAESRYFAFVDGDEEVTNPLFFRCAAKRLEASVVGAVVGMAEGHRFTYGLPMGMTVFRSEDFRGKVIPPGIDAREEYFVQRRLRSLGLRTVFLSDAKVHRSQYRKFKPEWEGANTRLACGLSLRQLLFALKVTLLLSLNSRSFRNMAYVPVFYLRFLRGFAKPQPWRRLRLAL
ncbi:MAG: glycosyltransferase family 2 protein [archaeon]|nr:MAG: glycosyltransferase family 2 protein [archaeon]